MSSRVTLPEPSPTVRSAGNTMTALVASLARPVVRGLLPIKHAHAAIAVVIIKGVRDWEAAR
jgi:hypothetical protein